MPFCVKCGNAVGGFDRFCGKCGTAQPAAPRGQFRTDQFVSGLTNRNAALLCYIPWIGWIAAIFVLASDRFRRDRQVRFHAFQGLYLFVAWLIVQWVFKPWGWANVPHVPILELMQLALLIVSVFMMVKAGEGRPYALPVIGDLAERSLIEK